MKVLNKRGEIVLARHTGRSPAPYAGLCEPCLGLAAATPFPTSTITGATNLFLSLCNRGNRVGLYNEVFKQWVPRVLDAEVSVALPDTQFGLHDAWAFWDGTAIDLEFTDWDQDTYTITAVTAANPPVLTTSAAHGRTVGDLVGVADIVGTVGTSATAGLNRTVWTVASTPTSTTLTLDGADTSGLAYTSGGTLCTIPNTRAVDLDDLDGALVQEDDPSRLYLGTVMTTDVAGESELVFGDADTPANWLLDNYVARRRLVLHYRDSTDSWTYTTPTNRPANGRGKRARVGFVVGVRRETIDAEAVHAAYDDSVVGGSTTVETEIGLDRFSANDGQRVGVLSASGLVIPFGGARYRGVPALGYHYLSWQEESDGAGGGTTTWYGDAGLPDQITGLFAQWRA